MAPAPKSRVPKGKIIEEPPTAGQLIKDEQIDASGTQLSSPPQSSNVSRRRSSVEAPPLRFQLRKQNVDINSNTSDAWITQRGATDEIREHLKHLGPSNLASRPRQTRYHNVKIKRGTSPSQSNHTDPDPVQSISSDPQRQHLLSGYHGGIGAGLVGSGAEAKDGAHALRLGYGSISSPDQLMTKGASPQYKDLTHVSIPEPVHEEREDQARSNSRKGSSGTGSIQSTDSSPGSFYHRGPARTGSITEQVVDMNGIRKVVLHTNNGNGHISSEGESSSRQSENGSGEDLIRL